MKITPEFLRALHESKLDWAGVEAVLKSMSVEETELSFAKEWFDFAVEMSKKKGQDMPCEAFPPKDKMDDEEEEAEEKRKQRLPKVKESTPAVPATPQPDASVLNAYKSELTALAQNYASEKQIEQVGQAVAEALSRPSFGTHNLRDINMYPPDRLTALCTEIQGMRLRSVEAASPIIEYGLRRVADESKGSVVESTTKAKPVIEVEAPKGYLEYAEKAGEAILDYTRNHKPEAYRAMADKTTTEVKKIIQDRMAGQIKHHEPELVKAWEYMQAHRSTSGAAPAKEDNLITTTNIPYRPLLSMLIQRQSYWQMMGLGLTGAPPVGTINLGDVRGQVGRVVQVRSEYIKSIDAGNPDFKVRVRDVPRELSFEQSYQTYFAERQKIGIRMSDEMMFYLNRAPLSFDMIAPGLQMISEELARTEDQRIHTEILQASDEYKPLKITSETTQDVPVGGGTAGEYMYSGGGGITFQGVTYGANVCGAVWMRRGNASGGGETLGPVVRTRQVIEDRGMTNGVLTGLVEFYTNPVIFAGATGTAIWGKINGTDQVLGYLDSDRQIQSIWPGETATFAVDWENGICVFKATATSNFSVANVTAGNVTFAEYGAARNFTRISQTVPAGFTRETYANTFISAIRDLASALRANRYTYPDFAYGYETIMSNISEATAFQPNTRKDWAMLATGFGPQQALGEVTGVSMIKTETPFTGLNRIRIGQRGTTIYYPTELPQMVGPLDEMSVANNRTSPTGVKIYYLEQTSLLQTITKKKQDLTPFEFPYTTLYVEGTNPATSLGIA